GDLPHLPHGRSTALAKAAGHPPQSANWARHRPVKPWTVDPRTRPSPASDGKIATAGSGPRRSREWHPYNPDYPHSASFGPSYKLPEPPRHTEASARTRFSRASSRGAARAWPAGDAAGTDA